MSYTCINKNCIQIYENDNTCGGNNCDFVFSKGDAVNSTTHKPTSSPNPKNSDGWIKATASCYGHYDWVENAGAMGCQYKVSKEVLTPLPVGSNCKGAAPGSKTKNRNYANTTCIIGDIGTNPPNKITQTDLKSGYVGAFNQKYWDPQNYKSECGKCLEVKCDPTRIQFPSGQPCNQEAGTIKLKVVDKMEENQVQGHEDYLRNVDINDFAFVKLSKDTGCNGSIPILWKPVNCD